MPDAAETHLHRPYKSPSGISRGLPVLRSNIADFLGLLEVSTEMSCLPELTNSMSRSGTDITALYSESKESLWTKWDEIHITVASEQNKAF